MEQVKVEAESNVSSLLGELLQKNHELDREFLAGQLSQQFEALFGELLNYIELLLPFEKSLNGQKSENELRFHSIRTKVLRSGNDRIRLTKELLKDFLVLKVMEHKKTVITFGKGPVK